MLDSTSARAKVYICFDDSDDGDKLHAEKLKTHLKAAGISPLDVWDKTTIEPGLGWQKEIIQAINATKVAILLISPNFLIRTPIIKVELPLLLGRADKGEIRIIPVKVAPSSLINFPALAQMRLVNPPVSGGKTGEVRAITSMVKTEEDMIWLEVAELVTKYLPLPQKPRVPDLPRPPKWPTSVPPQAKPPLLTRNQFLIGLGIGGAILIGGGGILLDLLGHPGPHPIKTTSKTTSTPRSGITPTPAFPLGYLFAAYKGHSDNVDALAWSPHDGKLIASGSFDTTVQVWDSTSAASKLTYRGHSQNVIALSWSPDGTRIASAGDDTTVQIWDAKTGTMLQRYTRHTNVVHTVAWSPDGQRIASGGRDNVVRVWSPTDGTPLYTYTGHSDTILSLTWSPDSQRIASASSDQTVQVWNASNGALSTDPPYSGHSGPVAAVSWSPDGKQIASGSYDKTVQVWDAATGNNVMIYRGHTDSVYAVAWSPDGREIASAGQDKTAQIWSATTGSLIYPYEGHQGSVNALAWSPDGTRIATGSDDTQVHVWEAV